jgi:hypothetical protein
MDRVKRRKLRKYKGLHPKLPKTTRRELSETERAFIAGACIARSLLYSDAVHFFNNRRLSKSTITRITQHIRKVVDKYSCKIIDPRCFKNLPRRGRV